MKNKAILHGLKTIRNYVALLICSVIIGFIMILAAYSINTGSIKLHIAEDLSRLAQETDYYDIFNGKISGCLQDNFSEAMYLSQAALDKGDDSLIRASLTGRYLQNANESPVGALLNYFGGNLEEIEIKDLPRFWNGWLVVLKPLLVFLTYSEIRYLNIILQFFLVLAILNLLYKKGLKELQLSFLLACLFINPVTVGFTMSFSGFYYIMLISSYVVIKYNDTLLNKKLYGLFFAFVGIIVFYFDMNYFQLCTLGIPLALYFYLNKNNKSIKDMLLDTIKYGASWLFGFLGMMLGKWLLYAIFVDSNIFIELFQHILWRTGSSVGEENISRLSVIKKNLAFAYNNKIFIAIEIFYILYVLYVNVKNRKHGSLNSHFNLHMLTGFAIVAIIAVMMRYFLEANHSYIHAWVMYRNLTICIFAINNVLAATMEKNSGMTASSVQEQDMVSSQQTL